MPYKNRIDTKCLLKIMADINFLEILSNSPSKQVEKGEILVRNGDLSGAFYYVEKGCLRSYTIDKNGKEHIFQFAPEDWIISDQEALMNGGLATLNIDAVENSEIKIIKRPNDNMSNLDAASFHLKEKA